MSGHGGARARSGPKAWAGRGRCCYGYCGWRWPLGCSAWLHEAPERTASRSPGATQKNIILGLYSLARGFEAGTKMSTFAPWGHRGAPSHALGTHRHLIDAAQHRHFLKTLMEGAKADTSLVPDQADGSDDDGSSAVGTQDDRDGDGSDDVDSGSLSGREASSRQSTLSSWIESVGNEVLGPRLVLPAHCLRNSPVAVICKTSVTTTAARAAKLEVSRRLKWSHYLMNRTQRSKKKEEKQHH
eukprot:COSAG06_NODE_8211_length_2237_cov_20.351263_1_plen_242_part_00